jgi:ligand-binding SRPBCC domain-containing protein
MPMLRMRGWVAAPIDEVFAFFDDPRNLQRLTPPPARIELVRVEPDPPRRGSELEFRYGIGPVTRRWLVRLVEHDPPHRLVDETLSGPVRRFRHEHRFRAGRHGTWIEDRIEYRVGPGGPLGVAVDAGAGLAMRALLAYRHAVARRIFG